MDRKVLEKPIDPHLQRKDINLYWVICANYTFDTDPGVIHQVRAVKTIIGFQLKFLEQKEMMIPSGTLFIVGSTDPFDTAD